MAESGLHAASHGESSRSDIGGRSLLLILNLTVLAVGLVLVSLVLSFRVDFPAIDDAVRVRAPRVLAAGAVGLSLAMAAALRGPSRSALFAPGLYLSATGAAFGLALGTKWSGSFAIGALLSLMGASLGYGFIRALDGKARPTNLWLGLVMIVFFLLGIGAYTVGSTESMLTDGLTRWLLGDLSRIGSSNALGVFVLALVGSLWAILARGRGAGTEGDRVLGVLLLGLGVGVGGPVAFVGWAATSLVRGAGGAKLRSEMRLTLVAGVGASIVIFADSMARIAIGGYAPPLNTTIAFIAIPAFLLWNRRRLHAESGGRGSIPYQVLEFSVIATISTALLILAVGLIPYVRGAT